MEIRAMHEALAVRLCCDRATRGELRDLIDLAERIYELAIAEKAVEALVLDRQLHSRLVALSGNAMLADLAEDFRFRAPAATALDAALVRDEHLAILRAILDGRGDDAERLVQEHIAAEMV